MENGVWKTISGRRIFIKKGQSLSDAMKSSGKFEEGNVKSKVKNQFDESLKNKDIYAGEKIEELKDFTKNKWLSIGSNGDLYSEVVKTENEFLKKDLSSENKKDLNKKYAQVMFALKKRNNIGLYDEIKFPNSSKMRL